MMVRSFAAAVTAAGLLFLTAATPAGAGAVDAVFVFGDSLSDTGNLAEIQGANFPNPPFFNDRVTNGQVAVDYLSEKFGLGPERPSLFVNGFQDTHNLFGPGFQFGTNYAIAGARAFQPGNGDLTDQVNGFLARPGGGGVADPNALYTVFIGGNDVRTAAHSNNASLITSAVNAVKANIQTLINKGAVHILVPNVGNVGGIPEFTQQSPAGQAALATADSILYNQLLATAIAQLRAANPTVELTLFDFFAFSTDVANNAAALGITNTTDPCLKGNFTPNANCFDAQTNTILFSKFLFWDAIHPTAQVQQAWGQGLIEAVPEPATLLVLGAGLLGMATIRRRAAA
ncbi:MAG TPA: SGNH/GDSL hydrolase family protein [Candidatus Cybelea sp.]|nr:SGNH/GDSL hydrolase family protein [Candidatus Cybelea sp.]